MNKYKDIYKTVFFLILIFCSVLVLLWRVFLNEIPVPYKMDYIRFLTQQIRVVEDIKAGHFPLWNPYILCGMPTIANAMTNLFSPMLALYFFIKDSVMAYCIVIIMTITIMGWSVFFMMRRMFKADRLSAYISAIVFILCGFMFWILNISMKSIEDLLFVYPLAFLFYTKLRSTPSFKWAIAISLVLVLGFLNANGSVLQFGYNMSFLLGYHIFCVILSICTNNDEIKKAIKQETTITVYVISAFILTLGLSAFQFLPVFEAVQQSTRFSGKVSYCPRGFFPTVLSFIYPDIWPTVKMVQFDIIQGLKYGVIGYCGIPATVLALIGACYHKNKKRLFFVIVPLTYLIVWPVYTSPSVQRVLPLFFRAGNHLFYSFYFYCFSMAILAGLGVSVIRTNIADIKLFLERRKLFYRLIKLVTMLLLGIYVVALLSLTAVRVAMPKLRPVVTEKFLEYTSSSPNFQRTTEFYTDKINYFLSSFTDNFPLFAASHSVKIIGLLLLILIIFSACQRRNHLFLGLLAGCVLLDPVFVGNQYLEYSPENKFYNETPEIKFLKQKTSQDFFRVGVFYEDSICFWDKNPTASFKEFYEYNFNRFNRLHENIIIRFGIQKIGAFSGLCPARQYEYFSLLGKNRGLGSHGIFLAKLDSPLLDMVNMKYVLSPVRLDNDKFSVVFQGDYYTVYENKEVLPRVFWVGDAEFVASKEELFQQLLSLQPNVDKKLFISEKQPPAQLLKSNYVLGTGSVAIEKYSPNDVTIRVNYNQPGWVVLADAYYPGWNVWVDDKKTELYPAYHLLRAVYVEQGEHTIKMRYFSDYMYKGIFISSGFVLIAGLLLCFSYFKSRN